MSAAATDRVLCSRCGANNFSTQAACWKCGTALGATAGNAPAGHVPAIHGSATSGARPDPAIATRAAATLGLLFPWAAVPAGLIFLMFDDRRRAEIGRAAIAWGVAGTILHTIATGILMAPMILTMTSLAGGLKSMSGLGRGADMNAEAPPLRFPGAGTGFPTPGPGLR